MTGAYFISQQCAAGTRDFHHDDHDLRDRVACDDNRPRERPGFATDSNALQAHRGLTSINVGLINFNMI